MCTQETEASRGRFCRGRDYTASSLEEYLEVIALVNECVREDAGSALASGKAALPRLWYRGHEYHSYSLIPSLLRSGGGSQRPYGNDHLREDYRYHHFRSKCNQLIEMFPETRVEWLELMQHHFAKTRLMDWSESAISALLFALEAFINPGDDKELSFHRATMTPTIWVLDPVKLNQHLYNAFADHPGLVKKALHDILPPGLPNPEKAAFLRDVPGRLKSQYASYFQDSADPALNGIVCLSVIADECQHNLGRMFHLLRDEEFNPYFYLLSRYYSDGLPADMELLPPLAIVHPYHSRRIQAQHGVFTVMPHYLIAKDKLGTLEDLRPMERQPLIRDCLFKIRIVRPAVVAKELLTIGERRASLYPELEIYAKDIETPGYSV